MTKKHFGGEISEEIADRFIEYCEQQRWVKHGALEAALRAFLACPLEVQARLLAVNNSDIYTTLVDGLVRAEVAKHLDKLGPIKAEFLALLKEAKERASRKK